MKFNKKEYDTEYNRQHVTVKRVPFNENNPQDVELLEYVNSQPNFTQYIKDLIRQDMSRR